MSKTHQTQYISAINNISHEVSGDVIGFLATQHYVATCKADGERNQLACAVLAILDDPACGTTDALRAIMQAVKKHTGIEAVGVRLCEGHDFPYYETDGFSDDFVRRENHLCVHDTAGELVRDAQGNVVLECLCGNVLCSRTNPKLPFFTQGGSFWSNCTSELLATTPKADLQTPTRNQCHRAGYESVALIPLRASGQIIGLLQLNDHRRNQFTLDMIALLEGIGASVGIALAQRHADEALHESRLFNDLLLRTVPFPLDVVDHEGRVLFMNEALLRLVGERSQAERCWTRYRDNKQPCDHCPLGREIRLGENCTVESSGIFGGKTFEIVHTGMVFQGKQAWLEIFNDVTEKRQLQTRLAQSDRLSTMGTLAAGIAHEINNALSYMLSNLQNLADDMPKLADVMRRCHAALSAQIGVEGVNALLGAEQDLLSLESFEDIVSRLRDALSGTMRIRAIARGLNTFSRADRTEVAPVNVHTAVEHGINMAFNEIKYRARLVKDFSQVPMVLGSDGKLAQVFLNLLINAAHAIREGNVELNEIRVRTWADGNNVFAEVSDTGKGIAPAHQAKIFEPYFTTKEIGKGTGLGLSICKNIITGFGGEISFKSEVGQGTRFLIRLPQIPNDWEMPRKDALEPSPIHSKPRGRILVVDDEAGIRRSVVRMLEREHEVFTASSGEEARALLTKDRHFDLIFCDLLMPQMSGIELHAWLAQCEPGLAERVIFIGNDAFTPSISAYLEKVRNLRLEKPLDAANTRNLVVKLVVSATPVTP